ncbi:NAD(P)-dependent oxidoreductase [Stappia sp. TSB10P1A]|uniref:NAD(P)-dependent oxidoreductase n=1 Tax=Stappia sp. TSB10P1A TaxID=2003585 RepID=UPI0016439384|nr:NAD(P)-dependent oxidoreductase [Stappia sp. TSB10P1A]
MVGQSGGKPGQKSGAGTKIAFIGLGRMGLPMAVNLLKAGYQVTGYDRSKEAGAAFAAKGGRSAASARAAANGADIVITMLPTSAIVAACLIGEENALADAAPGALVIDMSSSVPADTLKLAEALTARGLSLVDAPVSGGVGKAIDGTLAIMVGGEAGDAARAEPVLKAMGERIFRAGKLGAGHVIKVLNNYVSAAGALAAVEALIVGREFGLDEGVITDILNASTGRNNTTENKVRKFILSGAFNSGFDLALMSKDIGIAAGLAGDLGLDMKLLARTSQEWTAATDELPAGADHTEIYRYVDGGARRG